MLDNIAGLVLMVTLLAGVFSFPVDFALRYMVPGTAIGVMVGDLLFFWQAFRYARQTGNPTVTAMPLGLDTPSTIGMVLLVVGPAFANGLNAGLEENAAATQAWHVGICAIFLSGIIKAALSFGSGWIHRVFPRAGLLGSLAAIAIVLIAFSPLPELAANPIVGFASLVVVLATLISRGKLPLQIPGALGAVLLGVALWYLLRGVESLAGSSWLPPAEGLGETVWFPTEWLTVFRFEWVAAFDECFGYLGYIVPFAVATVIGGIDCTESAASVGDRFDTREVIGIEALATILASFCGGVIQTTPYIGHPAYKAMGGRAAYTLATALFIGAAGVVGYFGLLFQIIPRAAVLPILIFIGIEITAQSFVATPKRHYAAIALACLPAIAKLIVIQLDQFAAVIDYSRADAFTAERLQALRLQLGVLAGGFILTSLIWASATAMLIDRRYARASVYFAVGGILTLFGVMHSPLPGDRMFLPTQLAEMAVAERGMVIQFAAAYLVMAAIPCGLLWLWRGRLTPLSTDEEFEALDES